MEKLAHRAARSAAICTLLLGVLLGLAACSKTKPAPASAVETTFAVNGMSCSSCSVAVSTAAKSVKGVYSARADSDKGRAWVTYDAKRATPVAIAAAITKAGYKAAPLAALQGSGTAGKK